MSEPRLVGDGTMPLPDPEISYLMTDDIMLCPKCQWRTEWTDISDLKQVHTCLNPACRYTFHAEWDPEELDEDGNWVDPSEDPEHPEHDHCWDGCGLDVDHDGACRERRNGRIVCDHDEGLEHPN
jgi:hypothetical protein